MPDRHGSDYRARTRFGHDQISMVAIELLSLFGWPVFAFMSTLSFFIMWWDKVQSRKSGADRVSEGMLFFLAACFGSFGVLLGMFAFRHKTRRWYFLLGIPLLVAENIALLRLLQDL